MEKKVPKSKLLRFISSILPMMTAVACGIVIRLVTDMFDVTMPNYSIFIIMVVIWVGLELKDAIEINFNTEFKIDTGEEFKPDEHGWFNCNYSKPLKSKYDWVLIKIKDNTGFTYIPRVAELREDNCWHIIDTNDSIPFNATNNSKEIVTHWKPIE